MKKLKQNNLLLKVRKIKIKYRSHKKSFNHKNMNKIKKLMRKRKISRSNALMNLTQKINKSQSNKNKVRYEYLALFKNIKAE